MPPPLGAAAPPLGMVPSPLGKHAPLVGEGLAQARAGAAQKRGGAAPAWAGPGTFSVNATEKRSVPAQSWAGAALSRRAPADSSGMIPEASREPAHAWGGGTGRTARRVSTLRQGPAASIPARRSRCRPDAYSSFFARIKTRQVDGVACISSAYNVPASDRYTSDSVSKERKNPSPRSDSFLGTCVPISQRCFKNLAASTLPRRGVDVDLG